MAVTKTVLKAAPQEAVVKIAGSDDTQTISLINDLPSSNQVASVSGQVVDITGLAWSGASGGQIQISRNGVVITTRLVDNSGYADFGGQDLPPDSTENTGDIDVSINGTAECWVKVRKLAGYENKVEYNLYGSYDDENIIGPKNTSGSPGPREMPRSILPAIGSGEYLFTVNVDTSEAGTAYEDTSYYYDTPPANMTPGLYRRAFVGNFADMPGDGVDVNFCRNNPGWYGQVDTYVGFGNQDLEDASNYTFEWTGWFRAPVTGTYNFWLDSDDDSHMWMSYPALDGQNQDGNQLVSTSNNITKTNNSLIMTAGNWYPVRIQYGEWGGAEKFQVYWAITDSDGVAYAGNDGGATGYNVWYHNSETKGI